MKPEKMEETWIVLALVAIAIPVCHVLALLGLIK